MVRVSRRSGIAFVPVICALFLLVGAGLLVAGGLQLAKARSSTSWPTVTGTVLTSTVEATEHKPSAEEQRRERERRRSPQVRIGVGQKDEVRFTYEAVVTYSYSVDGVDHEGDRISIGAAGSGDPELAEAIRGRYPVGGAVPVHYDPSDPASSVLEPGVHGSTYILAIIGVVFLFMGALVLLLRRIFGTGSALD